MRLCLLACLATLWVTPPAYAFGVGERHLGTTSATAALRDTQHRPDLHVTVWYPAPDDLPETRRRIGPPARPLFEGGEASDNAPIATASGGWPVVLLSHGFGGSARMMSWFGTALARRGLVVVSVDHPGNTIADPMTEPGAMLWWERAEDLRAAWDAVQADAHFAGWIDPNRLGVAGFSAGGFTALVAAGARVDLTHFDAFCAGHPDDGVCQPQVEMAGVSGGNRAAAFSTDAMKAEESKAKLDHTIPGVQAAFVMAPALMQALAPASLEAMAIPVMIVLGSNDHVAPPGTNGEVAARLIPHAEVTVLSGVGHYDFLADCTEAGSATLPVCRMAQPQADTHRETIDRAGAFFATTLAARQRTAK